MSAEAEKIAVIGVTSDLNDAQLDLQPSDGDEKETAQVHVVTDSAAEVVIDFSVAKPESSSSSSEDAGAAAENRPDDEREGAAAEGSQKDGVSQPEGKDEEEKEECGFCLFMKGGPCGQRFTFWQECVDGSENSKKDIVQECAQVTNLLKVCMEMNQEYYGPLLEAEKAVEAEGEKSRDVPSGDEDSKVEVETTHVVKVVEGEGGRVVEDVTVETKRVVRDGQMEGEGGKVVEDVKIEKWVEKPQRHAN